MVTPNDRWSTLTFHESLLGGFESRQSEIQDLRLPTATVITVVVGNLSKPVYSGYLQLSSANVT